MIVSEVFSVFLPESSLFALIVIELISKLSFGFSNVRSLTLYFAFQKGIVLFPNYNLKDHSEF